MSPSGASPPRDVHGYWQANVRLVRWLLVAWFAVSFGAGILFVDVLDTVNLPGSGAPLGFWFAQQGAIYAFVLIVFTYVILANRLDRAYGVDEDDASA
jgi:putative solute:sodium symporter small subunit